MTGALAMVKGCDSVHPSHPSEEEKIRIRTCCPARQPELSEGTSIRVEEREGMGRMVAVTKRDLKKRNA